MVGEGLGVAEAVEVGNGVGVAVGRTHPNGVDVWVPVGVAEAIHVGDGPGVLVTVEVADAVHVAVLVAVAVGATMVRFSCWVVFTVSAVPAALVKARLENVIVDVPTTKPLSERVSTWTVPVWPLALLVVRSTR